MSREHEIYEQAGVAMTCRSFEEYLRMFALEAEDLTGIDVLDAAAGASSFTASARQKGIRAIAVDPLYGLTDGEMAEHGRREMEEIDRKLSRLTHKFLWDFYGDVSNHRKLREESFRLFYEDYIRNKQSGHYVKGSFPSLPFADGAFTQVLCSHFLFLYAGQFSYEFHLQAVRELLRVCRSGGEVRIYPLLDLAWVPYPHLDRLVVECSTDGIKADFLDSFLPFIPGSRKLLRLVKNE